MNKTKLLSILVLCAVIFCTSCDKNELKGIEGISFANYPKVDGSTSARAFNQMVACKLLGISYEWRLGFSAEWSLMPKNIPLNRENFLIERIKTSQTHGAFMNLIDGEADIIVTHRTISPDEKAHADAMGVTLIETSIALDAFVFVVHQDNPVKSLSINEIQKIYTKEITNWSEVGGNNINMNVYTRPRNSGSEEVFKTMVMDGLEPYDFPPIFQINPMYMVLITTLVDENAICYSFNNYANVIARLPVTKIAINGISPNDETVKNRTYPLISELHVAIRSDLDRNSMAYKLYEWLLSENAKSTIIECGFIPK